MDRGNSDRNFNRCINIASRAQRLQPENSLNGTWGNREALTFLVEFSAFLLERVLRPVNEEEQLIEKTTRDGLGNLLSFAMEVQRH